MRKAILYSGFTRTWGACKQNQLDCIGEGDKYFYTYELPDGDDYVQAIKIPEIYYAPISEHLYMSNKNPYSSIDSPLNAWHNQYVNFCLVPKGYDVYIKSRCDIQLSGTINFDEFEINDTHIYIPSGNDHYNGVNDQFAFGSYEVMKKYFSVYINHRAVFDTGEPFHPESYVTKNLQLLGVNIVRLNITNTILR
jgi:hypothetical protein